MSVGDHVLIQQIRCRHRIYASDRYRGTYRLVSTDTAVHIAAFFLTSRHFQGMYRDIYLSRYRLVRIRSSVRTPVVQTAIIRGVQKLNCMDLPSTALLLPKIKFYSYKNMGSKFKLIWIELTKIWS